MRLFVAVNLPPALREAIHAAAAPLREGTLPVKWVAPDAIHLTLKFLGDVPPARLREVEGALDRAVAGARPFPLAVGGFGAFPSAERARVVWIGCEAAPPLELLQDAVEREYAAIGFPVEGRPFRPHVTLGRARPQHRSAVHGLAARLEALAFADGFTVDGVDLMESTLTPAGARYAVQHHAALS